MSVFQKNILFYISVFGCSVSRSSRQFHRRVFSCSWNGSRRLRCLKCSWWMNLLEGHMVGAPTAHITTDLYSSQCFAIFQFLPTLWCCWLCDIQPSECPVTFISRGSHLEQLQQLIMWMSNVMENINLYSTTSPKPAMYCIHSYSWEIYKNVHPSKKGLINV